MYRRVCPLYTFDNARCAHVVGSAVPFKVESFCFLITATHACFERGSDVAVPVFTLGHEGSRVLTGRRIKWAYKRGVNPDLDISLIELTSTEARDLEQRYQFTTPAETATTKPKTPGVHYVVAGYPAARNRFVSPSLYPTPKATHLFTGDIQSVNGLAHLVDKTDEAHFALSLPYEKVPRPGGGYFRVPKAAGMSGGGIWRVDVDIPANANLASTPLLVGIGIEHWKGMFIGTRVQQAIPLLEDLLGFVAAGVRLDSSGAP
jgi:hypothetical protein